MLACKDEGRAMLQACLNGGRAPGSVPGLPVTAEALSREAAAVRAAGAACLHLHPRDASGAETLSPGGVADALEAVRAAVPGMPVGIGTGDWIAPGGRARHCDISGWRTRPDYASVNLVEPDAPEVAALLAELGVAVEAGIWSRADADRYLAEIDPAICVRILVEMPDTEPAAALAEAGAVLARLSEPAGGPPVLLHGAGRSAWPCLALAATLGLDARAGFEDMTALPDGTPAATNSAIVAAAREILEQGAADPTLTGSGAKP